MMGSLFEDYKQSVIYKITNTIDGKFYIGSAVNFKERRRCHLKELRSGRHHSFRLQQAFDRDGIDAFAFEIIEFVDKKENLISVEQKWINDLNPIYNICKVAGSALGVKRSRETIEKCRKCKKGQPSPRKGVHLNPETKELIRQSRLGSKQSPETIEKRMLKIRGIKKTPIAIERCRQMYKNRTPESLRKNWDAIKKPILEYTKEGIFIREHKGVMDAAIFHNVLRTSMSNHLGGRTKTIKGRIFKYKEKVGKCNLRISA